MSPPRWHIGHTSWFFETVLQAHRRGYKVYSPEYLFYFNSYYEGFGARIERPKRGTRSRPTVKDTIAYRQHIDEQMARFLARVTEHPQCETLLQLIRLGLEHEMQHQELLVYDIKHLLCDEFNPPLKPTPVSLVKSRAWRNSPAGYSGWALTKRSKVQSPKSKVQKPKTKAQSTKYKVPLRFCFR